MNKIGKKSCPQKGSVPLIYFEKYVDYKIKRHVINESLTRYHFTKPKRTSDLLESAEGS